MGGWGGAWWVVGWVGRLVGWVGKLVGWLCVPIPSNLPARFGRSRDSPEFIRSIGGHSVHEFVDAFSLHWSNSM